MSRVNHNVAAIRSLLHDAFTVGDLRRFCGDRDQFRHIVAYIPPSCSLVEAVDIVIERCEKELLVLELLREVKGYNPAQYYAHEHNLFSPSKSPRPQTRKTSSSSVSEKEQWQTQETVPSALENIGSALDWFWERFPGREGPAEQAEWALGFGAIRQFALLNDQMAVAATDTSIVLLDLRTRQQLSEIEFVADRIAVDRARDLLALADGKQVVLFDIDKRGMHGRALVLKEEITSMAFHPGKAELALQFPDERVELHQISDWKQIRTFEEPGFTMWSGVEEMNQGPEVKIAFSRDGRWLASLLGGKVALWQVKNGELQRRLGEEWRDLSCVAFSPNGATVAAGCRDGQVTIYRIANGEVVRNYKTGVFPIKLPVSSLAFSPDGKVLAAGTGSMASQWRSDVASQYIMIRLWQTASRRTWKTLEGHTDTVSGIGFIQDGKMLVSAGFDGILLFSGLQRV